MNLENTQVQMRKGLLEYCILHIISRGEVYASDMLDELTSARMIVVEGTLYPLLTRLKNGIQMGGIQIGSAAKVLQTHCGRHGVSQRPDRNLERPDPLHRDDYQPLQGNPLI